MLDSPGCAGRFRLGGEEGGEDLLRFCFVSSRELCSVMTWPAGDSFRQSMLCWRGGAEPLNERPRFALPSQL